MSNTISKSALVEHLQKHDDVVALSNLRRLIQSGRFDTDRWISVKDRLPESGNEYMFIDTRGEKQVLYYNQETFQPWFDSVTHWMPLPKPPKGDENA